MTRRKQTFINTRDEEAARIGEKKYVVPTGKDWKCLVLPKLDSKKKDSFVVHQEKEFIQIVYSGPKCYE